MDSWLVCCLIIFPCLAMALGKKFEEVKNCQPPSISEDKELYYYGVQKYISVPCTAKGTPDIKYVWIKDGVPLNVDGRLAFTPGVGTLMIHNPIDTDAGIYQCQASNECGVSLSNFITLLHAKMDPFPPVEQAKVLKAQLGANLKLSCKPPYSVPKATISWILANPIPPVSKEGSETDQQETIKFAELGRRITMDYEGNLHITSLRKGDEENIYVCSADNLSTRSTNKGEDKKIEILGNVVNEMAVNIIWTSDNDTLVLEGNKARFKCIFSGEPEPVISWDKVNGGRIDRSRTKFDYSEMTISEVEFSDAGEYECSGKNYLLKEPIKKRFTLRVQAAPKWTVEKPSDMTVGVDESASVNCQVSGDPKPTVEWFINGKPLEELPTDPHRTINNNIMTFTNLNKDDSQVIQCNASNTHGYIWSDVYLYVEAQAPVIERPPVEKIAAEQQNITVTCHVSGKPKPKVTWYKGVQVLEGDQFTVLDSGDLFIQNTSTKNSGRYKCMAENKFGLVEAEGDVIIREKTKIVNSPMNADVDFPNPATFICGATTDPKETLSYRWLKDGVEIKPDERIKISDGTLEINSTKSKDSGIYTCEAYNSLDSATAKAELKVKSVPEPPYNVSLVGCNDKAIVRWSFDEKMKNFVDMVKYIVEYTTKYTPGVWKEVATVPHPSMDADFQLSPYTEYLFRVKAVNRMGTSVPSHPSNSWCSTPQGVPSKNPDGVTTDEQETGFLVIKWNAMDEIDHNGPKFHYLVNYKGPNDENFTEKVVHDPKATEFKVPVQDVYKPYTITVKAGNEVGVAVVPLETVIGYSGEAAPLVVPENFELDPDIGVTSTSAGFRWDPVDTSTDVIRGKFSGYKIQFWKTGQKETTLHAHIVHAEPNGRGRRSSDGKIRGVVANLPSFSQIEAEVVVINKNFQSNGSNMVNFSTPEGVPGPVSFMVALVRGSHHFLLQWGRPTEENGEITGYQLSYTKIHAVDRLDVSERHIAYDSIGPEVERMTLKGLSPHSQYRIYIKAKTAMGQGKEYFIDVWTTSNTTRLVMPVVVGASPGENEANITWDVTADKGSRHGNYYHMEYKRTNAKDWIRNKESIEGDHWGVLKHLEPGTQYMVRVVAASTATDDGDFIASEPVHFVTTGVGAAKATFLTAAWFIGMMVAIAILILILIIVCIIKRNRGDNYPVQEKERLRGTYNDDNPDHFNGFGKGDDNGLQGSNSFDRDAEKVPLDEDTDSLDYGDDDASKFNEDGSFIGQYGRGEKGNEGTNASSIV